MFKFADVGQPKCEALEKFISSLDEWLRRFHDHREVGGKVAGSGTHARFEPFFALLAKRLGKEESFITDLLSEKAMCQAILLEGEQDTRDRVVRLYALYERFLQELREEVNGDKKGENCGKFGTWLYTALRGKVKHPPGGEHTVISRPIRAILPGHGSKADGISDAMSQLRELEVWFKKESFHIADYPAELDDPPVHLGHPAELDDPPVHLGHPAELDDSSAHLEWEDWHGFLYGIRNAEGHGNLRRTLLEGGCLDEERRKEIRKLLELVVLNTDGKSKDSKNKYQHYWALDMLLMLTDAEYRLWLAEGKKGKEITYPWSNVTWSEYKRTTMCDTITSAESRTEFEVCLNYSVKLWIPRMMKALTCRLVDTLIRLPQLCNKVSPTGVTWDQGKLTPVFRSPAKVSSDDDGVQ